MKRSLCMLQYGLLAVLLTGTAQSIWAQAPPRPMTIVYDENGRAERVKNEIIVRFQPNVVHLNPVDDLGIQDGVLTDFVKADAVEFISGKVGAWLGETPTYKIFTRMTSADTLSIDRLGETVPVEKLWSSFVLLLPASLNEQTVCDSLNAAFPTVFYAHPNWMAEAHKGEGSAYQPNDSESGQQANLYPTTQFPDGHINVLRA